MKKPTIILLIIFSTLVLSAAYILRQEIKPQQIVKETKTNHSGPQKIEIKSRLNTKSYSLTFGKCSIEWVFSENDTDSKKNIYLKLRNSYKCDLSFQEQTIFHKKILTRAFKDWDRTKLKSITTGEMKLVNPDDQWNKVFIKAAVKNQNLKEYKDHYPNHVSKLSINDIFIEIAKEVDVFKDFKAMFLDLDLKIEFSHCEKVFNGNAGKVLQYGVLLKRFGSVIYDAGSLSFNVI